MTKKIYVILTIGILLITLFLSSCTNDESEINNMNNAYCDEYTVNDALDLDDVLTEEYDIEELKLFFWNSLANEGGVVGSSLTTLTFAEVNLKFPVKIIRSKGYSVYKVSQGGYFYVFWINTFNPDTNTKNPNLTVYFSTYLPSSISTYSFDSLRPGVSTAENVKKIDPYVELYFLSSNGTFSYSYLNNDTILEIEYARQSQIDGYDDLIVKELKIISRGSAPSRYGVISSNDLPG